MKSAGQSHISKAKASLNDYILSNKLRHTPEREFLLELIYSIDNHFDVDDLHKLVLKSKFNLSKATLYNSLELFVDAGIVIRHHINKSTSIYEKAYGQRQHDQHARPPYE